MQLEIVDEKPTVPELICGICGGKPFQKYLNDDGVWIWTCLEDAARLGSPFANQLTATRWIEGLLEPVISVEGVQ